MTAPHPAGPPTASRDAAEKRALLARMLADRASAPRVFPLSFGQQRLWFLDRFSPGDPVYNIPAVFHLHGPLDVDALRAALDSVVARHGALRTTFADSGGEPVQVVHPPRPADLTVTDLSAWPATQRRAEALRLVQAEARRPFDLATGPLLRALVIRSGPDEHHLSLCLHHIVSDAWSVGVLFHELNAGYLVATGAAGSEGPAALPIQYADFAQWQRDDADDRITSQLAYWRGALAGAPALLGLPTDRPRPPTQSYRGAVHHTTLPAAVTARIRAFNQDHRVTTFMTLLAAYVGLLGRYSGQDDIVVGAPVAGRTHPDLEPLIGFFVNSVPLRIRLAGAPTFAELVDRVRETTLGGLGNADVPFERLVEELQPARSLGHAPIFQTQLILQNTPYTAPALGPVSGTRVDVDSGTAKFDMSLVGEPLPDGGLRLAVEYSTDLFDADTVARFTRHLVTLLDAGITQPGRRVAEVPLLTGTDRWRTIVDWNDTARPLPPAVTALDLLPWSPDAGAGAHGAVPGPGGAVTGPDGAVPGPGGTVTGPDGTVTGPDGTVTGPELRMRAARLGAVLRARGVTPDTAVGICLDRGTTLVAAVLGVWHAGAGYLPLDPALPAERLRYMLADAGTEVLITQRAVRDRLGDALAGVPGILCLDGDAAEVAAAVAGAPVPAHPDGLAYLIYTSGSTGRPKPVAVPHRAVVNLLASFTATPGLTPADRFAAVTTLSFDISVLELLLPLTTGAALTIVDAAAAADGAALAALLRRTGCTAMQATPATWRLLLAGGGVPATLRLRLCGGEALPRDLADALATDGAAVWNCYGPTETCVWSAAGPVPAAPAPVDLGTPIGNTQWYVLDEARAPVPVGVVGELHIGGCGVVRGYPGRAGLTAARFGPDPFSGRPGARLYATGDLARYRPDGRLDFLGRRDHQVKVRGFRIELGEIEELIRASGLVRETIVGTWQGEAGDTRLVAYVVPDQPGGDPWPTVRAELAGRLPEYMLPATAVLLAALPLSANGKVDRAALPEPTWQDRPAADYTPPRGPVEEALVDIWQEVLGADRVGVHDDFFRLGGHSLLGTRVVARVATTFAMPVPIRVLFEAPTVAAMATALVGLEPEPGHVATVAQLRRDVAGMSMTQVRALLGD